MPNDKCTASVVTKGRVKCDRTQYAFGLCQPHYNQARAVANGSGPASDDPEGILRPIRGSGFITLPGPLRVTKLCHDTVERVAKKHGVSAYELQRQILEAWAKRQKETR